MISRLDQTAIPAASRHHAGVGRGQEAGRQTGGHLLRTAAFDGNRYHAVVAQDLDQSREVNHTDFAAKPARRRVEWREVDYQRVLVKKIGNVAKTQRQLARQRAEVGGLEQKRHQRQVGTFDFEGGGGAGREGNGHGEIGVASPWVKNNIRRSRGPLEKGRILTVARDPVVSE